MGHFMMDDQNIFAWLCTSCVLCCFMGCAYIFYIIVTIILPPLPVFIRHHCEKEFWICLLLTICGYIPGVIYSFWINKFDLFCEKNDDST
uniref:Uncharacterized protein n=1 Tax=Oryza meridionalis TaxID=40149 RepID=A0A0E0EQR1_9ORYZ